jgi:hypothetical protein
MQMPLSKLRNPNKHRKGKAWKRVRKVKDTNEKSPTYGKMVRIARRSKYLFRQLPAQVTPEWKALIDRTGFDYIKFIEQYDRPAYLRHLQKLEDEQKRMEKAKADAEALQKKNESYIERMAREAKEKENPQTGVTA